jgi:AcrR family transcriptional regulator
MVTKALTPSRDSDAMRERILDAIGRMIVRDGLASVGINALAREAGCDKVLIYRYFDDLEGAYRAFADRSDFWWTLEDLTDGIDPAKHSATDAIKLLLRRSADAIRARPMTLAVLAAEPVERTPLVVALESVRERRALELGRWMGERFTLPRRVDVAAVTLLLGVALNYLAVRARKIRVMSGVAIKTDKDWERLFAAVDTIVDGVFGEAT